MKKLLLLCLGLILVSISEVQANLSDGLVACYPFSGNADDMSVNNLDGTVFEASLTNDRFDNPEQAYFFDGQNDYIEVENTGGAFDLVNSWSISVWAKPAEPINLPSGIGAPVVWKTAFVGDNKQTFTLGWEGDKILLRMERASNDEDVKLFSAEPYNNLTDWIHIVGTYDGNTMSLYLDGALNNSRDVGEVIAYTGPAPLRIGNDQYSGGSVFHGAIDDVRIYNRALSEEEVLSLVPEPATLSLFAIGALSLRRRKS